MAASNDGARTGEGATVDRTPSPPDMRYIIIRCAHKLTDADDVNPELVGTACGVEVDRVAYDATPRDIPAVLALVETLGIDEKAARKMLAEHNPDALRTQEEAARALTTEIVKREVADRDRSTYVCRHGHDDALEVSE